MTSRIEGEGPDKIPQLPSQRMEGLQWEIRIERASAEKGAEGVKDVQKDVPEPSKPLQSEVSLLDAGKIISHTAEDVKVLGCIFEAATVHPEKTPCLRSVLEKNPGPLLEAAKAHVEAQQNWSKVTSGALSIPETLIGGTHEYFAKPATSIIPLIKIDEVMKQLTEGIINADLIFKVPLTLGKGASLIYKRCVLDMLDLQIQKEEMSLAKSPDAKKSAELKELRAWMKVQYELLFTESDAFGLETLTLIPKALALTAEVGGNIGKTLDFASTGLLAIVTIAASSYAVFVAKSAVETHEEWLEKFKVQPLAEKPITASIKVELKDGEERAYEVPAPPKEMVEAMQGLLQKRKKGLNARMKMNQAAFENWALLLANSDKPFEVIKKEFKAGGVDLDSLEDPPKSIEELKVVLTDPSQEEVKTACLRQYAEKKETISVLVKNGLQALTEKKHQIERRFMNFTLSQSAVSFSLSTLAFAAILTLKVLAAAAVIALPTAALAYTGIGLFVAGIAILAIGLALLYYYKPNFFNELIRGVHIRLALYTIPHAFHNFRLNLNKINRLNKDLELSKMSAQIEWVKSLVENREIESSKTLPKELRPLLKKFQGDLDEMISNKNYSGILEELNRLQEEESAAIAKEQMKLGSKAEEIEKDIKKWADKIAPLRQRLVNAGWKDFERNVNLAKTAPRQEEGKIVPSEDLGLENVLVEGILNDDNYLDPQLKKMLNEQLGINLDSIRNKKDADKESIASEIREVFKNFFAMDDSALINFIKLQQAKFEFGV